MDMEAGQEPKAHAPSASTAPAGTATEDVPVIKEVTDLDDIPDGYDVAGGGDVVYIVRRDRL